MMRFISAFLKLASACTAICAPSLAIEPGPAGSPELTNLAENPKLFLKMAVSHLKWNEPAEPVKIAGPIYFVGTKGLTSFLIATTEGHILIHTGMPPSGSLIEQSIGKLGFKPADIKLLLVGHAHIDHVGAHEYLKKLSAAKVAVMDREVDLYESGGKRDFHYGTEADFSFEATKVDRVLRDGEVITLGDVAITALLTPGHTKGSTTYTMNVIEEGKNYSVVFPNGTSINPGYRIVKDAPYPGIADDYRRTFHVLEMLKPDIWLDGHTDVFDFDAKRARAANEGAHAWVDPEGYRQWLIACRARFDGTINAETGAVGPQTELVHPSDKPK